MATLFCPLTSISLGDNVGHVKRTREGERRGGEGGRVEAGACLWAWTGGPSRSSWDNCQATEGGSGEGEAKRSEGARRQRESEARERVGGGRQRTAHSRHHTARQSLANFYFHSSLPHYKTQASHSYIHTTLTTTLTKPYAPTTTESNSYKIYPQLPHSSPCTCYKTLRHTPYTSCELWDLVGELGQHEQSGKKKRKGPALTTHTRSTQIYSNIPCIEALDHRSRTIPSREDSTAKLVLGHHRCTMF